MTQEYRARAIRGASTVAENSQAAIQQAVYELLTAMVNENKIEKENIVSAIFTLTSDLNAEFPAKIARIQLNWDDVPMICAQEIAVPNSLPMCIRVLLTVNSPLSNKEIKHVYFGEAKKLRPDLA